MAKHVNFLVYWKPSRIGVSVDECKIIGAWGMQTTSGKPLTKAEIQSSWARYFRDYKAEWFKQYGRGYVELVQNLDSPLFLYEPEDD